MKQKQETFKEKCKLGGHHKRKLHTFTCDMCGTQAQSYGHNARYCESCKKRKQHNMNVAFIGKRDGREVFERVCVTCGLPFSTFFEDHEECAPCMKGTNAVKEAKRAKPVVSLAEQMKVIEAYNREHGTNLSYGKYMAMMGVRNE